MFLPLQLKFQNELKELYVSYLSMLLKSGKQILFKKSRFFDIFEIFGEILITI